jgi:Protein of unknown function (DUF2384)
VRRYSIDIGDDAVAALRGIFRIFDAWGINDHDGRLILGTPEDGAYRDWRRGKVLNVPSDTLRRIGYVAGIYETLQLLYSDARLADTWVLRPNRAFGGHTPLERMLAGEVTDLAAVRSYLFAARTPWS